MLKLLIYFSIIVLASDMPQWSAFEDGKYSDPKLARRIPFSRRSKCQACLQETSVVHVSSLNDEAGSKICSLSQLLTLWLMSCSGFSHRDDIIVIHVWCFQLNRRCSFVSGSSEHSDEEIVTVELKVPNMYNSLTMSNYGSSYSIIS